MPGTWPEARARKEQRQREEARHYTPDLLGRKCSGGCGLAMPLALLELGENAHPTCSAEFARMAKQSLAAGATV